MARSKVGGQPQRWPQVVLTLLMIGVQSGGTGAGAAPVTALDFVTSDYNTAFFLKQQGNSLSGVMHMDLMSFITAVGPQSVKGSLKNGKVTLVVGPGQGMPCQGTVAGSTMRLACQLGGRTVNFTMNRSTQKAIENKVAEAKTKSLNMRAAVEKGVRLSALFSEMKSISQRTLDVSLVLRSPELGAALQTLKRGEVPSGDDYCGPYVEIVPSILNGDLSEQAITTLASHSELAEYRASQAYFSRLLAEYTQLYSSVPAAYRAYYPYQGGPRSPEQVYAPDSQVFKAMQAVIADKINRATLALQAEMTARRKLRLAYQEFRDTTMQAMLVKHVREAYPDLAERSLELALEADEGESCTVIFE